MLCCSAMPSYATPCCVAPCSAEPWCWVAPVLQSHSRIVCSSSVCTDKADCCVGSTNLGLQPLQWLWLSSMALLLCWACMAGTPPALGDAGESMKLSAAQQTALLCQCTMLHSPKFAMLPYNECGALCCFQTHHNIFRQRAH